MMHMAQGEGDRNDLMRRWRAETRYWVAGMGRLIGSGVKKR